MQLVFYGKLRKYMGVVHVKAKKDAVNNPSLIDALVREDEEEEIEVPTMKRHKSLCKCSTFVAWSRWDILIENEDVEHLRKIASLTPISAVNRLQFSPEKLGYQNVMPFRPPGFRGQFSGPIHTINYHFRREMMELGVGLRY